MSYVLHFQGIQSVHILKGVLAYSGRKLKKSQGGDQLFDNSSLTPFVILRTLKYTQKWQISPGERGKQSSNVRKEAHF